VSTRTNLSSKSVYEPEVGYSRAVRTGPLIAVAGTTGDGDDIAEQARNALRRIESALHDLGATMSDVIRTRMFVTDISQWRTVGAAHAEFFGEIRPAATMVEVAALIEPHLLVEIEADAYVASWNSGNRPSGPGG
jgi:enamine deaminase RidA (YjgF/YER057c/UK114 family)